jgi:L-threonylcarbamoyladenylate synthase
MRSDSISPADALLRAVEVLRAGGLVAMPTETVYGLAADAENEIAVRRIFTAKGRPVDHPLIVHLAHANQMAAWADSVPESAHQLANAFWPGPLTLILPRSGKAAEAVTGGLATIGLRVPAHPVAQSLLQLFGGGVAAPSANRFGKVSPTTAEHVRDELGDAVDLILDGGSCSVGVESTILDLSTDAPCILRPGAITAVQIEQVLGQRLADVVDNTTRCAGRLASHYAPRAAVELVDESQLAARAQLLLTQHKRLALLCENLPAACEESAQLRFIPLSSHPAICAQQLYAALREADAFQAEIALIVPPPMTGLGFAVADRLRKAAGKG